MTQQALTMRQDQTLTTTKLTARDVFSIWLADQGELTQTAKRRDRVSGMGGKPTQNAHTEISRVGVSAFQSLSRDSWWSHFGSSSHCFLYW